MSLELNVCPNCNSFVGRDWTHCRSCQQELPKSEETHEAPSEPNSSDTPGEAADHPAPENSPGPTTAAPESMTWGTTSNNSDESSTANIESASNIHDSSNEDRPSLQWPKDDRFTPGRIAATVGAIALAVLVVAAAVLMITTANDDEQVVAPPTTTTTIPVVDYTDPGGSFSARFPSGPTRSELTFEGIKGASFQSVLDDGRTLANISVTQLPEGANQQDDEFLRAAMNNFANAGGFKVESAVTLRDSDPWKVDATMIKGNQRMNYRTLISHGRLYQIYVVSPTDSQTAPSMFSTLVDSFKSL